MINPEKYDNALYALQGILIKARDLAYQESDFSSLAKLLDYAEHLPRLISSKDDNTEIFADTIEQVAKEFNAGFVLDRYKDKIPESW